MATYWNGTTLAASSGVAQALGTYTVPANSYFIGQVSISSAATSGIGIVTVGGVAAAYITITGNGGIPTAPITAGPGQAISYSGTGSVFLSGAVLVNSPNP